MIATYQVVDPIWQKDWVILSTLIINSNKYEV